MKPKLLIAVYLIVLFFTVSASAQTKPTVVKFAKGATSAVLSGSVKGYVYRDYVFTAKSGQQFSVRLMSKNTALEFIIRNPAGENLNSGGATWNDEITSGGRYVVRVMLPRAAARRGESASYKLTIEIE